MNKEESTGFCPRCHATAKPGAAFCWNCGAELRLQQTGYMPEFSARKGLAYFAIVLLCLALITGAMYYLAEYNSGMSTLDFTTYENSAAGFGFKYPASWSIIRDSRTIVSISGENGSAFIQIYYNGNASSASAYGVLSQLYSETGAEPNNFTSFTRPYTTEISGQTMARLAIAYSDRGYMITLFEADGSYYSLVCGAKNNMFNWFVGTCDAVSDSITVTG